jgi:hypothetical protein
VIIANVKHICDVANSIIYTYSAIIISSVKKVPMPKNVSKIEKVCSSKYTDIPKVVFMPHNLGHCYSNVT